MIGPNSPLSRLRGVYADRLAHGLDNAEPVDDAERVREASAVAEVEQRPCGSSVGSAAPSRAHTSRVSMPINASTSVSSARWCSQPCRPWAKFLKSALCTAQMDASQIDVSRRVATGRNCGIGQEHDGVAAPERGKASGRRRPAGLIADRFQSP